ncbi:MAG: hypothetical protein PHU85_17375 [Phycisphaerae bacterium]|nr:hypothetical protein [Phycisphaerae bacterium]
MVYNNKDIATRTFFDEAGRTIFVAENYTDFDPEDIESTVGGGTNQDQDRVTGYVYNDAGLLTDQVAYNVDQSSTVTTQDTRYIYAMDLADTTTGRGSPVADGSLLRATVYPDNSDSTASIVTDLNAGDGGDLVETTYNANGSVNTSTDQRGVVHAYGYDDAGRLVSDTADLTNATGVDDSVLRVERAYDDYGRLASLTSYDATTGGNIVNQDVWAYDPWGNVAQTWQSHAGAAVEGEGVTIYFWLAGRWYPLFTPRRALQDSVATRSLRCLCGSVATALEGGRDVAPRKAVAALPHSTKGRIGKDTANSRRTRLPTPKLEIEFSTATQ